MQVTSAQKAERVAYDDGCGAFRGTDGDVSRLGFRLLGIGRAEEVERWRRVEEDQEGSRVGVGFYVVGLALSRGYAFGEEEG